MNTCQLLSAEVWHVANSKICTKAVDKTPKTFINECISVKIHEKSQISRNFTDFTEIGVFHGRRPISRKMSRLWNRELGWSLHVVLCRWCSWQFTSYQKHRHFNILCECNGKLHKPNTTGKHHWAEQSAIFNHTQNFCY